MTRRPFPTSATPFALAMLATLLGFAAPPASLGAGGGASAGPSAESGDRSKQIAAGHYRAGLRARDAAWRYEERAKAAGEIEEARRLYRKVRAEFEKAIASQRKAVDADPTNASVHEARIAVFSARREVATSLMSRGIYKSVVNASKDVLAEGDTA